MIKSTDNADSVNILSVEFENYDGLGETIPADQDQANFGMPIQIAGEIRIHVDNAFDAQKSYKLANGSIT
ncbi:MAG: hypothetical protein J5528_03515, partial [Firmicutes bacterium]|nr:hypothetical protein [Bacillota bacterium]